LKNVGITKNVKILKIIRLPITTVSNEG